MCIYMLTEINQDLYDCIANTVDISLLNTAIKYDGFSIVHTGIRNKYILHND